MNQSRKKKTTESARASEKKKQSVVTGRLEMRAWECQEEVGGGEWTVHLELVDANHYI